MEKKTTVVNVRNEEYEVFIGRPSKWGNPYRIGRDGTRAEVIEKFRAYAKRKPELMAEARKELKGKILGCFCPHWDCHGHVWVEICDGTD
jgi:hypothetical protein